MDEQRLRELCKAVYENPCFDIGSKIVESLSELQVGLPEVPAVGVCGRDRTAASQLPTDAPRGMFPGRVLGDGNCLFRSLAVFVYGSDESCGHLSLRLRTACELILNPHHYVACLMKWASGHNENPKNILSCDAAMAVLDPLNFVESVETAVLVGCKEDMCAW